jgi:uncharacterized PurR-regulated membrane protein YhhQ (DUF165 family)
MNTTIKNIIVNINVKIYGGKRVGKFLFPNRLLITDVYI